MLKARDIMESNAICVTPDTEISQAVKLLLENHINGVPVINNEKEVIGILCQSDLIYQQKEVPLPPILTLLDSYIPLNSSQKMEDEFKKIAATTVQQAMATDPVTVEEDTPVSKIASLMVERHFHTIPVVRDNKVVGVIGKEDILKTMAGDA